MVGPVAKRAGVAHLKAVMGLSERRACLRGRIGRRSATVPAVRRTRSFVGGFASLPMSAAGSATVGWSSCYGGEAERHGANPATSHFWGEGGVVAG